MLRENAGAAQLRDRGCGSTARASVPAIVNSTHLEPGEVMRLDAPPASRARTSAGALFAALLLVTPAAVEARFLPGQGSGIEQALRDYALGHATSPAPAPVIRNGAPSSNPASPSLIDRAGATDALWVALDQPIGDLDGARAYTLGFCPLVLAGARRSQAPDLHAGGALRRAAIRATLGGPTQRFEFRGEQALDLGDHVTADLSVRLLGSREPRDHRREFRPEFDPADAGDELLALTRSAEFIAATARDSGEAGRYEGLAAALRQHPAWAGALLARLPRLTESALTLDRRVARAFVLGLSVSADMYGTGFGRDLSAATLIGELGRPLPLTVNVGARAEEKVHGDRNLEYKLGLGTTRRLRSRIGPLGALDLTVAGGLLVRNDDRPNLRLGNVKLDAWLSPSWSATGAVIFSDHPERVGMGSTRGTVGLGYRFHAAMP